MYDYLLQITAFASAGIIVYLLARTLPRVPEALPVSDKPGFFERNFKKLPLDKIDSFLGAFFEKFLRKFRVVILKVENAVNQWIGKLRKGKEAGKPDNSSNDIFSK